MPPNLISMILTLAIQMTPTFFICIIRKISLQIFMSRDGDNKPRVTIGSSEIASKTENAICNKCNTLMNHVIRITN